MECTFSSLFPPQHMFFHTLPWCIPSLNSSHQYEIEVPTLFPSVSLTTQILTRVYASFWIRVAHGDPSGAAKTVPSHLVYMQLHSCPKLKSEVKRLTIGMISGENLSARGGESRGLVRFAYNMAMRFAGDAPNLVLLAAAGRSLLSMHEILRSEPRVVKYSARQALMTAYLNFVNNYVAVDGAMVYKFHCGCHMIQEIKFFGNCRATATWEDEAENGQDCNIAKTCHATTFAQSVFQKIVAGEREDRDVIEVDD